MTVLCKDVISHGKKRFLLIFKNSKLQLVGQISSRLKGYLAHFSAQARKIKKKMNFEKISYNLPKKNSYTLESGTF